ncbi:MAG: prefoldin subunit beta [Nitrososphaerota archaeon]|nr:prefoldin subunit beta [Candidatus Calditenuaceae archaeon]MDW8072760.1 prefoldin subunit beta [Nitrososphaerota archaeon]
MLRRRSHGESSLSSGQIPPSIQQQIARLQQLQQTLGVIIAEKQRLQAELDEISHALEELGKSADDVAVYKAVGPILVQTTKAKVLSELTEKRDLNDTRLKVIEKQEARTRSQLEALQKELQSLLGQRQE